MVGYVWNGSKMVVASKWNSNGTVTENIIVKREIFKQIFQLLPMSFINTIILKKYVGIVQRILFRQ